jgi:hypothetical protein
MNTHRPVEKAVLKRGQQPLKSKWRKNVITHVSKKSRHKSDQPLPDTSAIPWLEPLHIANSSVRFK